MQEVCRGYAQKRPRGHRQRDAQQVALLFSKESQAGQEADGSERHHGSVEPVDNQPQPGRHPGTQHEGRNDPGI